MPRGSVPLSLGDVKSIWARLPWYRPPPTPGVSTNWGMGHQAVAKPAVSLFALSGTSNWHPCVFSGMVRHPVRLATPKPGFPVFHQATPESHLPQRSLHGHFQGSNRALTRSRLCNTNPLLLDAFPPHPPTPCIQSFLLPLSSFSNHSFAIVHGC
jgi:hypothetical protein